MKEKEILSKAKKNRAALLLICIAIACVCIGSVFFIRFSHNEEPLRLSEAAAGGQEREGLAVKLDGDTLPVFMAPETEKDRQFYYVKDVNNHIYIVSITNETFKRIVETLNAETGELDAPYELSGILCAIDQPTADLALSNSYKISVYTNMAPGGYSQHFDNYYIKENSVSGRSVTVYTILVLTGVFFLIIAFGYLLPAMIRLNKGEYGILDEENMRRALEKYLPAGESLTAGIHGIGIQTEIRQVFGKCILLDDMLIPNQSAGALEVRKCKYSSHDVYIGISQHYLLLSECGTYKHLYEFNDVYDQEGAAVESIGEPVPIQDIGCCFPLAEIEKCDIKRTGMGALSCSITMKNGCFLKLMLPGTGGHGMPHHEDYRKALVAQLSVCNT